MSDIDNPRRASAQFGALLDVQFWFLGRDVEHPGGNLLCRLGLTREPAPELTGPSRYTRSGSESGVIIWPCGMLLCGSEDDCLLLRGEQPALFRDRYLRDTYDPRFVVRQHQHGRPCLPGHLVVASRWFADYEASIEALVGTAHRAPRKGSAPMLAPYEPCALTAQWSALSDLLESAHEAVVT